MAGKFAVYLFKFAIPVFFMISGFFLFRPDAPTNEKIKALKRKALHIFKILLFAELLSAVFFIAKALVVKECYAFDFSAGDILINCFTGTFFNGTLWFLYALFWSYVLMWIALAVVRFIRNRRTLHPGLAGENTNLLTFNKFTPPRLLNYLTAGGIIFLTHVIVRVAIRDNDWYDIRMFRNALMYGMPFILAGYEIRRSQQRRWYKRIAVTNIRTCALLFLAGYALSIGEYLLTRTSIDIYIGTTLSAWAVFTFCASSETRVKNKIMIYIGEKLSLYVYILHLFVIDILGDLGDSIAYRWCMPLAAVAITLLLSALYRQIKTAISHK